MSNRTVVRSISAIAACGAFAFALSGCGALAGASNTAKDQVSAAASSAAATASAASSSAAATASAAATTDAASGSTSSVVGVKGVDATPFTDAEKKQGVEIFAKFMDSAANGDWQAVCSDVTTVTKGEMTVVTSDLEKQVCAASAKNEVGSTDLSGTKGLFTPDKLSLQDNNDGTANVLFQGTDTNIKVVKVKDHGVLVLL